MKQDPILQFAKMYLAMHKAVTPKDPGPKKVVKKKRVKKAAPKKATDKASALVDELLSEVPAQENPQMHAI